MAPPDPNFRLNPERAIFVNGRIDQELLDRLTPTIVRLTHTSIEPISVYIDSPGGSVDHAVAIRDLLSSSDQNGRSRCRIITAVTNLAASAAADLLAMGDYAVAYPHVEILFHGIRIPAATVTHENASALAEGLRLFNNRDAMKLARKCIHRIVFRYHSVNALSLPQFIEMLKHETSTRAVEVLDAAVERFARLEEVRNYVFKRTRIRAGRRGADIEGNLLHTLIEFEKEKNPDRNWTFKKGGLRHLAEDFLLFNDYFTPEQVGGLTEICEQMADYVLTEDDKLEIDRHPEEKRAALTIEKARVALGPIWSFTIALSQVLHKSENTFTAKDAFWLGLIDEVMGENLWSLRLLVESVDPVIPTIQPNTSNHHPTPPAPEPAQPTEPDVVASPAVATDGTNTVPA